MSDLISRQAAIDAIDIFVKVDEENCTEYDIGYNDGIDFAISSLSVLPSAQPERCEDCVNFNKTRLLIPQPEPKTGKWLWADGVRCSVCNHKLQSTGLPSCCPNCGAKM